MATGRYCTAQDIRTYTGLDITDASDLDLEEFIDPATKVLINQIAATREWEVLSGSSEDSTVFFTEHYPIADIDGDATVDDDDVLVYGWEEISDAESKTLLTVTAVTAGEGRIKLSADPGSNYVTANYRFYPNDIDWNLVKLATALYAGHLFAFTKWVWIPDTYQLGPVRIRNVTPMWEKLHGQYVRVLQLVQRRAYAIREPWIEKSLGTMDTQWK